MLHVFWPFLIVYATDTDDGGIGSADVTALSGGE